MKKKIIVFSLLFLIYPQGFNSCFSSILSANFVMFSPLSYVDFTIRNQFDFIILFRVLDGRLFGGCYRVVVH